MTGVLLQRIRDVADTPHPNLDHDHAIADATNRLRSPLPREHSSHVQKLWIPMQPAYYRIYVLGLLDVRWLCNYIDMRIERVTDAGEYMVTQLTGELADQSALLGVLSRISDLGAPLLAFECLVPDPSTRWLAAMMRADKPEG